MPAGLRRRRPMGAQFEHHFFHRRGLGCNSGRHPVTVRRALRKRQLRSCVGWAESASPTTSLVQSWWDSKTRPTLQENKKSPEAEVSLGGLGHTLLPGHTDIGKDAGTATSVSQSRMRLNHPGTRWLPCPGVRRAQRRSRCGFNRLLGTVNRRVRQSRRDNRFRVRFGQRQLAEFLPLRGDGLQ